MAIAHLPPGTAGVIRSDHFPPAAAARVAATLLSRHSATEIAEAVDVLVDVLDLLGGDPDIEPNGDELDGTNAEDEIGNNHLSHTDPGAGCPISDPDSAVDDRPCDEPTQDLEPDHDAEIETWSHPDDHPEELFIGRCS